MYNDNLSGLAAYSKAGVRVSAGRIILLSLLATVGLGTILLKLPFSLANNSFTWFQAFFTAVSSTCVTGLSIVPFHELTFFGKLVVLCLIQIGGLGLMTFSFFLTWSLMGSSSVAEKIMASEILNFERLSKMQHFLTMVLFITFAFEALGAILLLPKMLQLFTWPKAMFYALFYSISAFCNAGITPNSSGLMIFEGDLFVLSVLGLLVFVGGLGFPVLYELLSKLFAKLEVRSFVDGSTNRLSLHSKIVLSSAAILVFAGTLATFLSQAGSFWDLLNFQLLSDSFFHSIFLRSAGFLIQPVLMFSKQTLFISLLFMLIGSSPGSTGGGLKTSTLVVVFASIVATLKGRLQTTLFGRAILQAQIIKAFTIVFLGICGLFLVVIGLLITDPGTKFFQLFFEAVSAISTTGLAIGLTANLSQAGQAVLILAMIAGRIGSLTFMFAFRRRLQLNTYKLPEERIFIG